MSENNPGELETYIARLRRQGMTDEAIVRRLMLAGWPASDLQTALRPPPAPVAISRTEKRWSRGIVMASVALGLIVASSGVAYAIRKPAIIYSLALPQTQASSSMALLYGARPALSDPGFYNETKEKFIEQNASFITADLTSMELVVYKEGKEALKVPILAKGKVGSWWETPVGIYEIQSREENHFSSFGKVYQPWSLAFQGNFFIHGWPYYPDGTEVSSTYSGGCIRLSTADAEKVYELASVSMPVIVHKAPEAKDSFAYQPRSTSLLATSSLAVDIKNGSVLASQNENIVVPIASITKLMTALVATEYLNLEKLVSVPQSAMVETAVPRLRSGESATVHDMLILMLTESSNVAAETLASALGRERFINLMNEKAGAIGLAETSFSDPSGLSEANVSSARDLFLLLQYLYENRRFVLEITSNTLEKDAYGTPIFKSLQNFNIIYGIKDEFVGGKIGNTDEALETYAGIYMLKMGGEVRPVGIIMLGSSDVQQDVKKELSFITSLYTSPKR